MGHWRYIGYWWTATVPLQHQQHDKGNHNQGHVASPSRDGVAGAVPDVDAGVEHVERRLPSVVPQPERSAILS